MGACISTWMILDSDKNVNLFSETANVITINGELRQFPIPLTVSQLETESSSSFFICNSDSLYYDQHIPALDSTDELQSGQIYFILPNSKLNYPLSASDMAALAVKASSAISSMNNNTRSSKKKKKTTTYITYGSDKQGGGGLGIISRSGSMGKLQRYSSRRPNYKLGARSFKRLTTIHEVSDLQAY